MFARQSTLVARHTKPGCEGHDPAHAGQGRTVTDSLARTKSGATAGGAAAVPLVASSTSAVASIPALLPPAPAAADSAAAARAAAAHKLASTTAARALGAGPAATAAHLRGVALFGGLAYLTGAAPWALPAVYLAWAAVALPVRVHEFVTTRRAAFLLEFCYWINLGTIALLVGPPVPPAWEASARALADGPIAAALLVWQCPWDFGVWSAGTSVLLHLLPGLALYARAHHPPPPTAPAFLRSLLASPGAVAARAAPAPPTFASLWAAPFGVYVAWQVAYGLILQASPLRELILARRLDTSYRTLARRAAGAGNIWARICRGWHGEGGPWRKVMGYGFLQVLFTAVTLGLAAPAHATHASTVAWQAAKFAVPLYYGARVAGDRGPKRGVARLLKDAHFVGAVAGMAGAGAGAAGSVGAAAA